MILSTETRHWVKSIKMQLHSPDFNQTKTVETKESCKPQTAKAWKEEWAKIPPKQ